MKSSFPYLLALTLSANALAWQYPGGDAGGSQYSPLTQITTANVGKLELAWSHSSGEAAGYEGKVKPSLQATPLYLPTEAGGHLVSCTPHNKVLALDPATGSERWRFDAAPDLKTKTQFKCRGISYWEDTTQTEDSQCRHRLYMATVDRRIIALDAIDGKPCADFGDKGTATLYPESPDPLIFSTSPPVIVGDTLVVGSQVMDFSEANAPVGVVKALDVRSGATRWDFYPIPQDDNDPAAATWPTNRLEITGAANAWAQLSVDGERGLVFVPTGAPSPDFYGVLRPGDNRYANSLVALNSDDGSVAWHFQFVHHDLWDYDTPAQPTLIDVRKDGKTIAAVAQVTKQGMIFVFNRETGEPLFPIEERPVPGSEIPGEQPSPTQPFVDTPRPLLDHHLTPEDGWGFIPFFDEAACEETIAAARSEGIYTPVGLGRYTVLMPGAIGGMNWGGAAYHPGKQVLVTNYTNMAMLARMIPIEETTRSGHSDTPGATKTAMKGTPYGLDLKPLLSPLGIPCTEPPWGKLAAVDMLSGEVLWESALGSVHEMGPIPAPFEIDLGTPNLGGALVTESGVIFIAATTDRRIRAFDLATGKKLWSHELPFDGNAIPMTYKHQGRQYVVIAAGGHPMLGRPPGDKLVAFALPK